ARESDRATGRFDGEVTRYEVGAGGVIARTPKVGAGEQTRPVAIFGDGRQLKCRRVSFDDCTQRRRSAAHVREAFAAQLRERPVECDGSAYGSIRGKLREQR